MNSLLKVLQNNRAAALDKRLAGTVELSLAAQVIDTGEALAAICDVCVATSLSLSTRCSQGVCAVPQWVTILSEALVSNSQTKSAVQQSVDCVSHSAGLAVSAAKLCRSAHELVTTCEHRGPWLQDAKCAVDVADHCIYFWNKFSDSRKVPAGASLVLGVLSAVLSLGLKMKPPATIASIIFDAAANTRGSCPQQKQEQEQEKGQEQEEQQEHEH